MSPRKPIKMPKDYPLEGWFRDRVDEMIGQAVSSKLARIYMDRGKREREATPEYQKALEKRARKAARLAKDMAV